MARKCSELVSAVFVFPCVLCVVSFVPFVVLLFVLAVCLFTLQLIIIYLILFQTIPLAPHPFKLDLLFPLAPHRPGKINLLRYLLEAMRSH